METLRALCCLSGMVLLQSAIAADNYPNRPIRFLVPGATGSSQDLLSRIVANKLSQQLNQQVVVDVRAGASGVIGIELGKAAAPDGYTIIAATSTLFAGLPALKTKLSYDPDRDFAPLTRMATVANVMTVNAALGVESVADLVKLAKAKPGQLNYGSAGNGSPAHLAGAMFDVLADVKTSHVPYKGAAQALTDVIGGQLQYLITSPLVAMPHAKGGRIKVLATTGAVVGEYLGGRDGLGALINIARGLFDTPLVFVAIVWLIAITLGLSALLSLIERRLLRYII